MIRIIFIIVILRSKLIHMEPVSMHFSTFPIIAYHGTHPSRWSPAPGRRSPGAPGKTLRRWWRIVPDHQRGQQEVLLRYSQSAWRKELALYGQTRIGFGSQQISTILWYTINEHKQHNSFNNKLKNNSLKSYNIYNCNITILGIVVCFKCRHKGAIEGFGSSACWNRIREKERYPSIPDSFGLHYEGDIVDTWRPNHDEVQLVTAVERFCRQRVAVYPLHTFVLGVPKHHTIIQSKMPLPLRPTPARPRKMAGDWTPRLHQVGIPVAVWALDVRRCVVAHTRLLHHGVPERPKVATIAPRSNARRILWSWIHGLRTCF